ncbi:alpha/beta hydrolase [Streptosporangium canum]|uniref:alpha/beta hydrolase n=1 Tax=Streptosporangium canum TaxID=324952 RepID=UPI003424E570
MADRPVEGLGAGDGPSAGPGGGDAPRAWAGWSWIRRCWRGEYDDNTPPQDSRHPAAQLPGARYLPAVGGHALYLGGHPCVREHAHRYLTTGAMPQAGAACGPAAS